MASYIQIILVFILAIKSSIASHDDGVTRIESEVDESSCICGLNKDILDRMESFIHLGASVCLTNQVNQHGKPEASKLVTEEVQSTVARDPSETITFKPTNIESNTVEQQVDSKNPQSESENKSQPGSKVELELNSGVTLPVRPEQTKLTSQNSSSAQLTNNEQLLVNYVSKLSSEISWLQTQLAAMTPPSQGNQLNPQTSTQTLDQSNKSPSQEQFKFEAQPSNSQTFSSQSTVIPSKSGVASTGGEAGGSSSNQAELIPMSIPNSEALLQLNQSQNVEAQVMETALQSTVPSMVSSIFTSMQKLEIQSQKDNNNSQKTGSSEGGKLTSIDGSSVEVQKGDSSEQITASGERLFLKWIEHQLESLHLTASVANYIRKSSINMFRRIVKQYVEHMEKLGGSVNENVRRATQMALDNTQTLTSFLLKNYINFAGGLMQIIGEQVSRVGKQLDSTGGAIAHISLNPFDIVSNVIDSLPNPSDYSKYFRAFGKQLMGESTTTTTTPSPLNDFGNNESEQESESTNKKQAEPASAERRPQNIITKTMGALSKLFG